MIRTGNTEIHPSPGHRYFSWKLFKYLFLQYLVIVFCCICGFLSLFIIISLFDDLDEFVRHNAGLGLIVHYVFLKQPQYLVNVIPISILISTVYTLSSLGKHHEITAVRASGISIIHFCFPVIGMAIFLAVCHFAVTEKLVSPTRKLAEALKKDLIDPFDKRRPNKKSYLAYRNRENRRDWFFGNFNAHGKCFNISVTQFRPNQTVHWDLVAKEGEFRENCWNFKDVTIRNFDEEGYLVVGQPKHQALLRKPNLTENPLAFSFLFKLKPLEDLSASQISKIVNTSESLLTKQTESVLKTYFYYYLFLPFSCLVAVCIGIPLSISNQRKGITKSFILSVAIIGLYYLTCQFFVVLGKNQVILPVISGVLPLVIFGGLCVGLMRRKL